MRDPIPDLWDVACILSRAVDAHRAGDRDQADAHLRDANRPEVRAWTESLWGSAKSNPNQSQYRRLRPIAGAAPHLPKAERVPLRMPSTTEQAAIIAHYGRHCVFCGVPLVHSEIRRAFHRSYPEAVPWGSTNQAQHAAFQALWLQFDHILPHSRGGDNTLSNIVVTCAGCNFGRMANTLEELGLIDPRSIAPVADGWDGLSRLLDHKVAPAPALQKLPISFDSHAPNTDGTEFALSQSTGPVPMNTTAANWFAQLDANITPPSVRLLSLLNQCAVLGVSWHVGKVLLVRLTVGDLVIDAIGIEPDGTVQIPWFIAETKEQFRSFAESIANAIPGAECYETTKAWAVSLSGKKRMTINDLLIADQVVVSAFANLKTRLNI